LLTASKIDEVKNSENGFAHSVCRGSLRSSPHQSPLPDAKSESALQSLPTPSPHPTPSHPSIFAEKLHKGQFVVTGEVAPPKGVDCSAMIASIQTWAPICDAVNITDNQGANLHLSSLAASRIALEEGVESIFQQTCRDRNRLALQSDLLAAHMFGLRNFLAVTGDNPSTQSSVRRMFDLNSTQLLKLASGLNHGVDYEGNPIGEATSFYLGAAAFLDAEPWDAQLARIYQKIEAGAQFFQTQAVMDVEKAIPRIEQIQRLGAKVIPGVLLLKNSKVIGFINNRLEGLHVPTDLASRIASASDPFAEAIEIAIEQTQALAEVADGIHIMPLGEDSAGVVIAQSIGLG
jgi:5,10-methylenetetrahydrofolate reductase